MAQKSNRSGGVSASGALAGGGRIGQNGLEDGAGSMAERIMGVGWAKGAGDGTAMGGKTCTDGGGGGGGGSWASSADTMQTRNVATPSSLPSRYTVASMQVPSSQLEAQRFPGPGGCNKGPVATQGQRGRARNPLTRKRGGYAKMSRTIPCPSTPVRRMSRPCTR